MKADIRESDYVYVGLSGGYSTLLGKTQPMNVIGSGNVGGHVGYEYRTGLFLLRAGMNFQYFNSKCATDITMPAVEFTDAALTNAVMHYNMRSPLMDKQSAVFIGPGIMAGYSQNSNSSENLPTGGWYVLVGVNVFWKYNFRSNVSLDYTTTASYDRYINDYHDMPNHYYSEQHSDSLVTYGGQGNFFKKTSVMISLEPGYEFNLQRCIKLKLGLFFDIGVTNIMKYETSSSYKTECDLDNVSKIHVDSYYNSPDMSNKYVIPMMVGLKVGVSFNVNKAVFNCKSINCNCYRK